MNHIYSAVAGALLCYFVLEGYWQHKEAQIDNKVRNLTGYTVQQLKLKKASCIKNDKVRCEIALRR